jgi:hypothetical protein
LIVRLNRGAVTPQAIEVICFRKWPERCCKSGPQASDSQREFVLPRSFASTSPMTGASHVKTFQNRALLFFLILLPACGGGHSVDSSTTDAAATDAPRADAAATDAPRADAAATDAPRTDAAATDAPRADATPGIDRGPDLASDLSSDMASDHGGGADGASPDAGDAGDARDDGANACAQAPVALGAAAGFAVLAGPTVTNTGLSTVTGDLGTSPGMAIVGFGPGVVVGTQHAGDTAAMLAQGSLTTAFNDAAGRTLCPVAVSGNLGGQTLTPGLYKSTGFLEISSGDLTLNAQGDPNAIFIFQMASTLITTTGRMVLLTGGAKAANIIWQVGTSATLGGMSTFQGTILADQTIILNTGAVLNGRALARIAAVTLDTSTVTLPAP